MSERALHEIYLAPFRKAIVDGRALAVMTSYNFTNGIRGSENDYLVNAVLRGQWGFPGLVMSDWMAVYSAERALKGGLDLEMPNGMFINQDMVGPLLRSGKLSVDDIDSHVRRILWTLIELGAYERETVDSRFEIRPKEHRDLARMAAEEGVILLKNEGDILPLEPSKTKRIAVIGPNARRTPTGGGGAAYVEADCPIGILEGLTREFAGKAVVEFIEDIEGRFAERDSATIGEADAVVACMGYDRILESESYDRSWRLPDAQEGLLREAASLNRRMIVVVNAGGDFGTEGWLGAVPAFLHVFYLGVEGGTAIAAILSGRANPSGKLPFTFARRWEDHPATANYPRGSEETTQDLIDGPAVRIHGNEWPTEARMGVVQERWDLEYEEDIFLGYRHFDSRGVEPRFPFGFGLSYTRFTLSSYALSEATIKDGESVAVRVSVKNAGSRRGAEVVQVYVRDVSARLPRPEKELKGFERVLLDPGCEADIEITLGPEAFRYYDDDMHAWIAEPGEFEILVGTSCADVASAGTIELR